MEKRKVERGLVKMRVMASLTGMRVTEYRAKPMETAPRAPCTSTSVVASLNTRRLNPSFW